MSRNLARTFHLWALAAVLVGCGIVGLVTDDRRLGAFVLVSGVVFGPMASALATTSRSDDPTMSD